MRKLVKNIVTEAEAELLLSYQQDFSKKISHDMPPLVRKVLDKLHEHVEFQLHEESYWRIQNTRMAL